MVIPDSICYPEESNSSYPYNSPDGVARLEEQGVTDVIIGFRWAYDVGPDTEALQTKLDNLRRFADDVIAEVAS
jgi:hypothetical protein